MNVDELEIAKKIISKHPLFEKLTSVALDDLANLFTIHLYHVDENIVVENEIVDSIYFIITGNAEVIKSQYKSCIYWKRNRAKTPE